MDVKHKYINSILLFIQLMSSSSNLVQDIFQFKKQINESVEWKRDVRNLSLGLVLNSKTKTKSTKKKI